MKRFKNYILIALAPVVTAIVTAIAYCDDSIPVKSIGTAVPKSAWQQPNGEKADCQPENFDPGIAKFHKEVKMNMAPTTYYEIDAGGEDSMFNINGWLHEGESKVLLPKPYELIIYTFGCLSTESHVLEIKKNGRRFALYQHVKSFSASPKTLTLFLENSRRLPNGHYEGFRGLIDIPSKRKTALPKLPCIEKGAQFDGHWLISRNPLKDGNGPDVDTDICVWNTSGRLQARLQTKMCWGDCGANNCSLLDCIRMLPNDPGILSINSAFGSAAHKDCRMALINLTKPLKMKLVGFTEVEKKTASGPESGADYVYPRCCESPGPDLTKIRWNNTENVPLK